MNFRICKEMIIKAKNPANFKIGISSVEEHGFNIPLHGTFRHAKSEVPLNNWYIEVIIQRTDCCEELHFEIILTFFQTIRIVWWPDNI
ncbi:MAG TPA: hypothetical protein PK064_12880 [Bacteroidales bacterium]|jgi:hypothetical protein|nr:hypothetical protein [Bacteroidales bacterium]